MARMKFARGSSKGGKAARGHTPVAETPITIRAKGPDCAPCLNALAELIKSRFGEEK